MNDTIKTLIERRSCKKLKSEQIKKEELDLILQAGMNAPTGKGMQSPIILVLQDKEKIEKLREINKKILGRDVDPFYNAPTVLVVMADKNMFTYVEDGSLVLGNMITPLLVWVWALAGFIGQKKSLNLRKVKPF